MATEDNSNNANNVHAHPTSERSDLEQRLADARSSKESLREERNRLESDGELLRKVVEAEQAAIDEAALLEAEREHGARKIATCETDLGLIILKRSHPLMFKRFQDNAEIKTKDLEILVRPCVIHPDRTRFDSICEELPATLTRCADRVATLAGIRAKEVSGK